MAAPKRTAIQRERDRSTISELYLRGWTQLKIAEFLELSQSQVSRELSKIKARWQAEATQNYGLLIAEQLHRLSML